MKILFNNFILPISILYKLTYAGVCMFFGLIDKEDATGKSHLPFGTAKKQPGYNKLNYINTGKKAGLSTFLSTIKTLG